LQDGAEEFFLKPVKLADMKKLKSHLLKRKQPKEAQAQQGQAVELEPEQQLDPRAQPAHDAEETAAEPPPAASNGTADGGNKRKAAAMEEEGMLAVMTVAAPESSTKPRLSTTSNSLAVET
jgi:two-component response regulator ARR-A family